MKSKRHSREMPGKKKDRIVKEASPRLHRHIDGSPLVGGIQRSKFGLIITGIGANAGGVVEALNESPAHMSSGTRTAFVVSTHHHPGHARRKWHLPFNTVDVAAVFLDNDVRVKRYAKQTQELNMIRDTDVDRPLPDLASNLEDTFLIKDCSTVPMTLGIIWTHFKAPHRLDDRTLRLPDLPAQQAVEIIERSETGLRSKVPQNVGFVS
jgi:hypothetical protein